MSRGTLYERVEERRGFKFIRLKSGRLLSFWDAHSEAVRARPALGTAISRMFKLVGDEPFDQERLEWFVEQLEDYVAVLRTEIDKVRGVRSTQERIALLRNTTGRTPEEAEAFTRKADELERRLEDR
jgi:hypothetical protein